MKIFQVGQIFIAEISPLKIVPYILFLEQKQIMSRLCLFIYFPDLRIKVLFSCRGGQYIYTFYHEKGFGIALGFFFLFFCLNSDLIRDSNLQDGEEVSL